MATNQIIEIRLQFLLKIIFSSFEHTTTEGSTASCKQPSWDKADRPRRVEKCATEISGTTNLIFHFIYSCTVQFYMSYDREQLDTIKFSVVLQATSLFSFHFIVKEKYHDRPTEQF